MNYKLIANYIGNILRIEGLFMIPALLVSLYHNEFKCVLAFGISIAALLVIGQLMHMIKPKKRNIFVREGFAIVSLSWLAISLFGALPFFISREIPNFIDCFFETVSGFTTTGSVYFQMSRRFPKVCSIGEASRIGSVEWAFLCSCLRLYQMARTTTLSRSIF